MSKSILLIGAGGHARACIDVIEQESRFVVAGLIGLPHELGFQVLSYPVLGTDVDLSIFLKKHSNALVTLGQIKTPELRIRSFDQLLKMGFDLPVIISPMAYVSPHATIGAGTIIMHGAIVNAGAIIGANCIINTHALIEHDAVIGDHCHISTSAVINGGVTIGNGTFIGSNATIRHAIHIGERCIIGMGQLITKEKYESVDYC